MLLGLKVENKRALANRESILAVPGLGFAEWGPGDMGMSLGYPDLHDAPEHPPDLAAARARTLAACKAAGKPFLAQVRPDNVIQCIADGVMIGAGPRARAASEVGRQHTGRTMPW